MDKEVDSAFEDDLLEVIVELVDELGSRKRFELG